MLWLISFLLLTLFIVFYIRYKNKRTRLKKYKEIEDKWSKPVSLARNFKLISSYQQRYATDFNLSDSTAGDIDFEQLFAYLDRTNSKIGQQYLYNKLKSPANHNESLLTLDNLVEHFVDSDMRQPIAYELSRLSHVNAYFLHELFTDIFYNLYSNRQSWYIKFAGVIWLAAVVCTITQKSETFFVISMLLSFANLYLHIKNKEKVARYVHTLPQLNILVQVADRISDIIHTPESQSVKKNIKQIGKLRNYLSFVSFEDRINKDPSDFASGIWELLKTFLLIEPAMFIVSMAVINKQRKEIEILFNYVAHLDFAISIQSLRQSLPFYSKPVFISEVDIMVIEDLFHPLVGDCVPNSIEVSASKGVLITGSNMSGKTTFIRSIAVNTLLSQTLFTSCAKNYRAPFLTISTSIRISDDIANQKSYFQVEALSVLNILNKSMQEKGSLIIIDEIFKGTNTIERVAAAKAILSFLTSKRKFIFVSTHDLELAELLGDEYAVYSFEETVCEQRLVFDYKLKNGILKNKNGIAILSALGYPAPIVSEAYLISDKLRQKYNM